MQAKFQCVGELRSIHGPPNAVTYRFTPVSTGIERQGLTGAIDITVYGAHSAYTLGKLYYLECTEAPK